MSTSVAELSITADERYLQSLIYGLIISTGILSMIVCSLRLYTRAFIIKVLGLDDIAVCVALIPPLLPSTLLTLEKAVLRGDVPLSLRLFVRQNQLAVIPSTDLRQTLDE
ncbi:hypothetical protein N7449_009393 [Penicillium cf. viridicatum]|uniref:Uncharacterized protein n=1 Tax=Penicillium cf. viridicatum TaxID=2972119 RepID=A0A9W9JC70_9EURO|nr:hypothetical protein N7449_009393 [Penicillium cf. viridicatum]